MTDRLPSLRGVETFVCVAEVLNLRVASERLNVTVSAISHRIQALEEELGILLFDRSGGRMRLTTEGADFLEQLRPGLAFLQEATSAVRKSAARPMLRISAPPVVHDQWLLSMLDGFQNANPGVRFELLSSGRRRAAGCDLSIVPMSPSAIRDGAELLLNLSILPMCSPEFLARHPIDNVECLLSLPLLEALPALGAWKTWLEAAGFRGDCPAPAVAVDNQILLYQAAIRGLGVALGAQSLVGEYLRSGQLVAPLDIVCDMLPALGIIVHEGTNVRLARSFADALKRRFASGV